VDAAAHAYARALAEERTLAEENARARAERVARAEAGAAEAPIGAAPALAPPTAGAVLARFGVVPDRDTGLLVSRAGVRLAAPVGQPVAAPAAGTVARVAAEPDGSSVVLDLGEGWTAIVGGLASTAATEGQAVAAGQALGAAAGPVTFEVWRGRHPVDPVLLLRRTPAARPLAAAPPLP
jgi:murein DD-endopeptidase MepM/ murein hydrolase activator NlpD